MSGPARAGRPPISGLPEMFNLSRRWATADACPALLKKRTELAQDFVGDVVRNRFELFGASRTQIDGARLIAAHDAGRPRAGGRERHRKTCSSGETASTRDRHHDGHAGQAVELARRYHQHGPLALLLRAGGRVERNEIDVAALHESFRGLMESCRGSTCCLSM